MTNWAEWFTHQLKATGDGFTWAMSQIDDKKHLQLPPAPKYLGEWEPVRHVWHVTEYERMLVIPSMRQWLGGEMPDGSSWRDDDDAWSAVNDKSCQTLLDQFQQVRQAQVDMMIELAAVDWNQPLTTLWGEKPLSMVVTKTVQHTYEHGDTLLRMSLWWDEILVSSSS